MSLKPNIKPRPKLVKELASFIVDHISWYHASQSDTETMHRAMQLHLDEQRRCPAIVKATRTMHKQLVQAALDFIAEGITPAWLPKTYGRKSDFPPGIARILDDPGGAGGLPELRHRGSWNSDIDILLFSPADRPWEIDKGEAMERMKRHVERAAFDSILNFNELVPGTSMHWAWNGATPPRDGLAYAIQRGLFEPQRFRYPKGFTWDDFNKLTAALEEDRFPINFDGTPRVRKIVDEYAETCAAIMEDVILTTLAAIPRAWDKAEPKASRIREIARRTGRQEFIDLERHG